MVNMEGATLVRRRPLIREGPVRVKYGLRWSRAHAQLRGSVLFLGDVGHEVAGATQKNEREFRVQVVGDEKSLKLRSEEAEIWTKVLVRAAMSPPTTANFEVLEPIGRGGGGEVYLVRRYGESRFYAMKVVRKADAFQSNSSLRHALDERLCLELARSSPFIVRLEHAFQDERALYHVTEFCRGGDLRQALLRRAKKRFTEDQARLMFAQLVLAIQHLHSLDILYRDLKPDNVLLSTDGRDVRLCDFGLAKVLPDGRFGRTKSFCGTSQFMAPEMVQRRDYGIAVDLWGLGALFYRVLVGHGPFDDIRPDVKNRQNEPEEIYDRIQIDDLSVPNFLSSSAQEMLRGLLQKSEEDRWNISDLMESRYFSGIDWSIVEEEGQMKRVRQDSVIGLREATANFETGHLRDMKAFEDDEPIFTEKRISTLKLHRFGMKKPSRTDIIGFGFSETNTVMSSTDASEEEDISDKVSPLKREPLDDYRSFRSFSKLRWSARSTSSAKYVYAEF